MGFINFFNSRFSPGIIILTYHNISHSSNDKLTVSVNDFLEQITLLSQIGEIISMDKALDLIDQNTFFTKYYFVLTFDDGYSGVYEHVFPIIKRLKISILIYLTTNFINKSLSAPISFKPINKSSFNSLSWEQIRIMISSNLVFIGAHTSNHFNCDNISPNLLISDLNLSNSTFLNEIGFIPKSFAYPRGYYTSEILPIIRYYYDNAVTTNYGKFCQNDDLFLIPRVFIDGNGSLIEFERSVTGVILMKRKIIEIVKKINRKIKIIFIRHNIFMSSIL